MRFIVLLTFLALFGAAEGILYALLGELDFLTNTVCAQGDSSGKVKSKRR